MRLVPFIGLLLAGCASSPAPGPPAPDLLVAAEDALAAGDGQEAMRHVRRATADGDLFAMRRLSVALERGYLAAERRPDPAAHHVPVRVWPGEAMWWRHRFAAERDRRAAAGDPDALLLVAEHLYHPTWRNGAWHEPTPAARDSMRVVLESLAARGHADAMLWLATLAHQDGRDEDGDAWLRRAEARGSVSACTLRAWRARLGAPHAAGLAAHLDRLERCRAMPGGEQVDTESPLAGLRAAAEAGTPEARVLLDSLVALRR